MKTRTKGTSTPLLPAARHQVRQSGRGGRTFRSSKTKQPPVTISVRWVNPSEYAFTVRIGYELAVTA